jgi:hypothetical protein
MEFEGVGEMYTVEITKDLVIGQCAYRIEVLKGIQRDGLVPGILASEPFVVRFYKQVEAEINLADIPRQKPVLACFWVKCRVDKSYRYATLDGALREAMSSLVEVDKSARI